MKVDKIIPCVCWDPNNTDSIYDGMPQLTVSGGKPHTFFTAFCPNCGRGGLIEYKSAYLCLRAWNKMQEELRNPCHEIFKFNKILGEKHD